MNIEGGAKKVIVAMRDPDSRNNGKGIKKLQLAGVEVVEDVIRNTVENFLAPYLIRS